MINILAELKKKYNIKGIKVEFEDEGLSFYDALNFKNIAEKLHLDLSIKIGGCGSINDIKNVKAVGANAIIAPMIESKYAFQKFVKSIDMVYGSEKVDLYVNIETKTGLNSLDEILNCDEAKYLKGVVLGRSDMAGSFEFDREGENMLDIARYISKKTREWGKEFIIGGGITPYSVKFLSNLGEDNFDCFETRKIIFGSSEINSKNAEHGILQAIEFEIKWLKSLKNPLKADFERVKNLEEIIRKVPANN